MGLINFVKNGVQEMMIARPDGMKQLIVYKHPDGNIPTYSRLTVDLDECAVFFKSGQPPAVGALPPGRYPLSTENIPFLNNFVTSFTGGNIFQAEVFFVKNQPIRNLTFGGQMMSMRDPELDLRVTPRAYGTYSMVVVDPIRFIIGYTGQAAQGDNEQITLWLRQRMFQGLGKTLAGFLKSGQTTFMDLGGVAPDLAAAMARDCPDFSEIGVRILEIGELKISVSEEDQARIDELQDQIAQAKVKARVAKVGVSQAEAEAQQRQFEINQAGNYQNYAVGRAMIGAGQGMAKGMGEGGVAGIGAQAAIGMAMGGWMQNNTPAQPVAPAPPAAPVAGAGAGKVQCPKCQAQVPVGKFCQECGGALAARRFCTSCGSELGVAKFCSNCGMQAASPVNVVTAPHGLAGSPRTAEPERQAIEAVVRRCPTCQQHFSGDARFCPFDGDPLAVAEGYRPDADPLLGKLIDGRYEVESVLGEGGMGSVYAVRHRALDKRFAMKVMRADLAKQGELAARFIQEARATAAIKHPNIVEITDFGELPSGAPYFVMELLEGTPLSRLIRKGGPLPAALAVRVLVQTASALAAAHAAGVIHRDLKPDNIHLSKNNTVKVLDFGVAKMAGAGRLTRTGMVFGTPHYMSPEQASGGEVDHRADMYALGIIMYEMFTGKVPFEADSYMGVLTKHMFMDPDPPSQVNEAARELGALEDVTLRCLEKRPEARYASMDELVRDIETIAHFTGDKLEIVRPSSHFQHRRSLPANLADELEPPAREEMRESLRVAGVPVGTPPSLVAAGIVAGVLAIGAIAYALLRGPGASVATTSAPSLVSSVAPPATSSPPSAADTKLAPLPEPAGDVASVAPASSEKPPVAVAVPPKPKRPKSDPSRAAAKPTSTHTGFGPVGIVNPWAH